jgi:hypothetical protein
MNKITFSFLINNDLQTKYILTKYNDDELVNKHILHYINCFVNNHKIKHNVINVNINAIKIIKKKDYKLHINCDNK